MLSSQIADEGKEIRVQSPPDMPLGKMEQVREAAERSIRIHELFLLLGCMMIVVLIVYWSRAML